MNVFKVVRALPSLASGHRGTCQCATRRYLFLALFYIFFNAHNKALDSRVILTKVGYRVKQKKSF